MVGVTVQVRAGSGESWGLGSGLGVSSWGLVEVAVRIGVIVTLIVLGLHGCVLGRVCVWGAHH